MEVVCLNCNNILGIPTLTCRKGVIIGVFRRVFVLLERTVALPIMRHSGLILSLCCMYTILSGMCHPEITRH